MNRIIHGHAAGELEAMPAEWADCCVTSPPYWGLRDYGLPAQVFGGSRDCAHLWEERSKPQSSGTLSGKPIENKHWYSATRKVQTSTICARCGAWSGQLGLEPSPKLYVEHIVEIFRQVRRALKKTGTLWVTLGDCYATGAGSAKSAGGLKGPRGQQLLAGSFPNCQPNRMPIEGLKAKDLVGIPWRVAFALQEDGWYLRSDIIWQKPNAKPSSVKDRPTQAHEYIFLLSKSEKYYYDYKAVREPQVESERSRRLREHAAGLKTVYNLRSEKDPHQTPAGATGCMKSVEARHKLAMTGLRNRRSVWTVSTRRFPGAHFATFPEGIAVPCVLAGTPPGGVVLDPFAGAATVPLVALKNGRQFIGIELNQKYAEMGRERIKPFMPAPPAEVIKA